jgi:hypothetical protein
VGDLRGRATDDIIHRWLVGNGPAANREALV